MRWLDFGWGRPANSMYRRRSFECHTDTSASGKDCAGRGGTRHSTCRLMRQCSSTKSRVGATSSGLGEIETDITTVRKLHRSYVTHTVSTGVTFHIQETATHRRNDTHTGNCHPPEYRYTYRKLLATGVTLHIQYPPLLNTVSCFRVESDKPPETVG